MAAASILPVAMARSEMSPSTVPGNVNALGLLTGTNATSLVDAQISGTLTVNGDPGSAGTSVTINSGQMGSSLTANQVVIQSGTTVGGSGAIFVGGNAPGSSLNIGPGGLQVSNIACRRLQRYFRLLQRWCLQGQPRRAMSPSLAIPTRARQYHRNRLRTGGQLDLGASTRVFDIGDGAGPVDLFLGLKVVGTGGIAKIGAGTLEIGNPGSPHTYTGITTVNDGTLLLTGSLAGAVTVGADGVLAGTGTIAGATTIGGALSPGASPGTLDIGDTLAFSNGSALSIELGGLIPGDGIGFYDQVNMTNALGSVTLGANVTLNLALIDGYLPVDGDDFYILTRADAGAFSSPFAGLPEGRSSISGVATAAPSLISLTGRARLSAASRRAATTSPSSMPRPCLSLRLPRSSRSRSSAWDCAAAARETDRATLQNVTSFYQSGARSRKAEPVLIGADVVCGGAAPVLTGAAPILAEADPVRGKADPVMAEVVPVCGRAT
jgi:autotransporter-associated beta strand protein